MKAFFKKRRSPRRLTLVIGATGKTGSRVAKRLTQRGVPIRMGSRSSTPAFDWLNRATWKPCLRDVEAVYISYSGDLAVLNASEAIEDLVADARAQGVKHLTLLTGRGEAVGLACEGAVQESGLEWTIVRSSWFNQNFSEGGFAEMVQAGEISLPAGEIPEPFIDADDIADVAVAALTEPGHAGEIYEVTGPRLMTFSEVASDLSKATGREIKFTHIPHEAFIAGLSQSGAPENVVWLMNYLFGEILDGRNAYLTDDVERALGRPPKDFADFARHAANAGCWRAVA